MSQIRVHPRVCGERRPDPHAEFKQAGSSPRVWGTLPIDRSSQKMERFIPACVGNARPARSRLTASTVHPRVCGERSTTTTTTLGGCGSSPRVWGTRSPCPPNASLPRFIPACVGNASAQRGSQCHPAVHPRVCGERFHPELAAGLVIGSSPRVWGTPAIRPAPGWMSRFIPACVGNAHFRIMLQPVHAVHPRVCGERDERFNVSVVCGGSSPRVWGTHCHN